MIIDTDTLIRYFTHDDEDKARRATEFFKKHTNLELTDVTLAEVYWTLSSFYQYPKKKIISGFRILLRLNWFECNYSVLNKTLDVLASHNTSFIDAYTAAYAQMHSDNKVVSFDKGYDKVKGIKRIEP